MFNDRTDFLQFVRFIVIVIIGKVKILYLDDWPEVYLVTTAAGDWLAARSVAAAGEWLEVCWVATGNWLAVRWVAGEVDWLEVCWVAGEGDWLEVR